MLRIKINESELLRYEEKENKKFEDNLLPSHECAEISKDMETIKIPVMGEDLKVTKSIIEDNINITKEPIIETKTIEVKLSHEEILIERRPVNKEYHLYNSSIQSTGQKSSSSSSYSIEDQVEQRTEISIPLKKEEVSITKKPYVKEEIVVKKKPITETKEVSEEVTFERVNTSELE